MPFSIQTNVNTVDWDSKYNKNNDDDKKNTTVNGRYTEWLNGAEERQKAQEEKKKQGLFDIDGKIEDFLQGSLGDCWLLSSVSGLSNSKEGAKILSDSIKNNKNGTYTIELKGANKSYTFSDSDLTAARESNTYSTGDPDVLLIELAVEKYLQSLKNSEVTKPKGAPKLLYDNDYKENANPINAGPSNDGFYLLTGKKCKDTINFFSGLSGIASKLTDNEWNHGAFETLEKSNDFWATTGFNKDKNGNNAKVRTTDGKTLELTTEHSWNIIDVDDDTLTLVNPWDTKTSYTVNRSDVDSHILSIAYYNFA